MFGSLLAGFLDLLKNPNTGIINNIQELFTRFIPTLGEPSSIMLALGLTTLCGLGVCLIYRPLSNPDAFTRGLSILTIFAITATPPLGSQAEGDTIKPRTHQDSQLQLNILPLARPAFAQEPEELGNTSVQIKPEKVGDSGIEATAKKIVIRDKQTGKFVGQTVTSGDKVLINQPVGEYSMEVEIPGYRRSVTTVPVAKETKQFSVTIPDSSIPQGLQKFYPAKKVSLTEESPPAPVVPQQDNATVHPVPPEEPGQGDDNGTE